MKYLRYILLLALVAFSEICRADTQLPSVINSSLTYISNDGSGVGEMPSSNGLIITNDGTLLFQDKIDSSLNTYLNVVPGGLISLSNFGKVFLYSSIGNQAVLNMNGNKLSSRNIGQIFLGSDTSFIIGNENGGIGNSYLNLIDSHLYSYSLLRNNVYGNINVVSSASDVYNDTYPSAIENFDTALLENYGSISLTGGSSYPYDRSYLIFEDASSYVSSETGKIFLNQYSDILNLSSSNFMQNLLSNIIIENDGSSQLSRILFLNPYGVSDLNMIGNSSYEVGNSASFKQFVVNSLSGSVLMDFRNQNLTIEDGAMFSILSSSDDVVFSFYNANLNINDGGWLYIGSVFNNAGQVYINDGGRLTFAPNSVYNIGTNITDQTYFFYYGLNTIPGISYDIGDISISNGAVVDIMSEDNSMWRNFLAQNIVNNGSIFLRANMQPQESIYLSGNGSFNIVDDAKLILSQPFSVEGTLNVGNSFAQTIFDKSSKGNLEVQNTSLYANTLNVLEGSFLGLYDNAIVDTDNDIMVNGLLFGNGNINLNGNSVNVSNGGYITSNINSILNIDGNLSLQNGGSYLAIISPQTTTFSPSAESKIIVSGKVSFNENSYIAAVSDARIIDGVSNKFPILVADSEDTNNPLSISQHLDLTNSLFTNYTAQWVLETEGEYAGKHVLYIIVNPSLLKINDVAGLNYNEYQVANLIDDLYDDFNLEMELNDAINFIYTGVDSVGQLKYVLDDLSVEKYATFSSFVPELNYFLLNPAKTRTNFLENVRENKNGFWIYPIFSNVTQNDIRDFDGFKNDFNGVSFGIDKMFDDNILGVSFVIGNSSFLTNDNILDVDTDVYNMTLYGAKKFDKIFVNYGFGFASFISSAEYDFSRLPSNLVAKSNFTNNLVNTYFSLGYLFSWNEFNLYPSIGTDISYVRADDFCETQAGGLNRCIDSDDFFIAQLPVSFNVSFVKYFETFALRPELFISYARLISDNNVKLNASFENTNLDFISESLPIYKNKYSVGLNLNLDFYSSFNVYFKYFSDFKEEYKNNQFMLGINYLF